jgi:hypothetical protein
LLPWDVTNHVFKRLLHSLAFAVMTLEQSISLLFVRYSLRYSVNPMAKHIGSIDAAILDRLRSGPLNPPSFNAWSSTAKSFSGFPG